MGRGLSGQPGTMGTGNGCLGENVGFVLLKSYVPLGTLCTSLCLSGLTCKVRIMTELTSQVCCED